MTKRAIAARPKKRNLVRWNDDLDELLLLTVWSVCKKQGVRIPWDDVAKEMGIDTTGSAIEQHLKKLHTRRIEAKKKVPPAPSRGSGSDHAEAPQKATTRDNRKPLQVNNVEDSDEEWVEHRVPARRKRKLPQPRYVEDPEIKYEDESNSSASEVVATGATFLQLPNDRHQEAPRSSSSQTPSTQTRIMPYRCAKKFLASLEDENPGQRISSTPPGQTPGLNEEPVVKLEPVVKPEPMTPNRAVYDALPRASVFDPMPSSKEPNVQPSFVCTVSPEHGPNANVSAITTSQPSTDGGLMYIPTGNPAIDLPRIGDIFTDPLSFNGSLPPLQGFDMGQSFLTDQGFEDMLGEYFIPADNAGYYGSLFGQ
ncbi:hypothetical protein BDV06DRAFT_84485 [Aspergillus oleicola]